jgi:hypothetical protein
VTNKLVSDGQNDLKERIRKLISFRDEKEQAWQPEEAVSVQGNLKSRYRKVMTCSFVSAGGSAPTRRTMAAQTERNRQGCDRARK